MVHYFLFGEVISLICGCGGMADAADSKSAGFTIVWVQVPPSALKKERSQVKAWDLFFFRSEGLPCPYGPRSSSFHFGPSKTKVHRTLWTASLRSAQNKRPQDVLRPTIRIWQVFSIQCGWVPFTQVSRSSSFHFGPCFIYFMFHVW